MYTITANNEAFTFDEKEGIVEVNNSPTSWDLYRLDARHVHILLNKVSYRAQVVSADYATKSFTFIINNNTYTVQVQDRFDLLLKEMGIDKAGTTKINHIHAPMPGLVLRLIAEPGMVVKKGDSLLVLEAMKMENIIKAPADITIKSIRVQPRQAVEKGEMLIEVE